MIAYLHHFGYEFRGGVRDRSHMLLNYLFPLAFFLLAGALMGNINPAFRDTMIPAMVMFAVMSCFLLGMPSSLVASRDVGVLRSFRINGVPGWTTITMPVVADAIHMLVVTLLIGVIGAVAMSAVVPASAGQFILGWVLGVASTAGVGALIAVVASSSRATILLAQLIFIPSIILGGLMMPPEVLSPSLARISSVLPAAHAMRVFEAQAGWQWSAVVLATGAILAFSMTGLLYEWDTRNQRPARTKLLAITALVPYVVAALIPVG
jgi:ABC-2 type transport system permease protein